MSLLVASGDSIYEVKWGADGGFDQNPQKVVHYKSGGERSRIMMSRDTRHIWSINSKGVCCRQLDGVETGSTTFHPIGPGAKSTTCRIGSEGQLFHLTGNPKDVTCYSSNEYGKVTSEKMISDCNMKYLQGDLGDFNKEIDEGVRDEIFPPYDRLGAERPYQIKNLMWLDERCYSIVFNGWQIDENGDDDDDGDFWQKTLYIPLEGEPYDALSNSRLEERDPLSFDCDAADIVYFVSNSYGGYNIDERRSPKSTKPFPIKNNISWIWEGDSQTLSGASSAVAVAEHPDHAERIRSLESQVEDLVGCLAHIQKMVSDLSKRD